MEPRLPMPHPILPERMGKMAKRIYRSQRPRNIGQHDPCRRLIAACVLQAVIDYIYPVARLPKCHRRSAAEFVHSEDGKFLLSYFGVNPRNITRVINKNGAIS